jgi:hypothetical protein
MRPWLSLKVEVGYCVEVMRFVPEGADREVLHLIIQYVCE